MSATNPFDQDFNWLDFLEAAIKQEPSEEVYERVKKLARDWPTCACGQLCKSLPRNEIGAPLDSEQAMYGYRFSNYITWRDWPFALATFRNIEARTAELLAKTPTKSTNED